MNFYIKDEIIAEFTAGFLVDKGIYDLVSNPAAKLGSGAGYTQVTSITDIDKFAAIIEDNSTALWSDIRAEIKILVVAKTFTACTSSEKIVASKWFVVEKTDRDTIHSENEQKEFGKTLTKCLEKSAKKAKLTADSNTVAAGTVSSTDTSSTAQSAVVPSLPKYTTTERNALTTLASGMYIYNTTRNLLEWYDGQVWLNCFLRKRQNKTGVTLAAGVPVYHDSANTDGILRSSTQGHIAIFGVVVDGTLTADGWLTVAIGGDWDVLCNGTVTRNQLVKQSATLGEAETTSSGTVGAFAITNGTRSGAGASLVKCFIHKCDTF